MSAGAILRVKKLKRPGIVRVAAAHNLRAIQAELGASGSIDATRTGLNVHLAGPEAPELVADLAVSLMADAGLPTLRKDAVRALEFVVSLPPGRCADEAGFFTAAMGWLASSLASTGNILCADIHNDEAAPHMHLLLLPLVKGRMVGSDLVGGPAKLRELQAEFFAAVCEPYGLKRYPRRLAGASKAAAAAAVLSELRRRSEPCLGSRLWPLHRDQIESHPEVYAEQLGIEISDRRTPKRMRTMTEIFISQGKGPKRESEHANHIGFASPRETEPYAL